MQPNIGITKANLTSITQILNTLLADVFVLYAKTRNAHWNVEGPDFHDKHKFFEAQYDQLDEIMDEIAERIRTLGHYAPATLKAFLDLTHLTEQSREKNDSAGFIKELLADHENIIIRMREHIHQIDEDFKDVGTSDFLTGLMEEHEKMAWMLRSHLK
jgi:starvation-inducible DNA-binding protein